MKKMGKWGVVIAGVFAAVWPGVSLAQTAVPEEVWVAGIRYLKVTNTSGINTPAMNLYCRILTADGTWAALVIAPGQFLYKAVHPSYPTNWSCAPA